MASLHGPIELLLNHDYIEFAALVTVLVIAISIHEFSHAYAAFRLGDSTPEREGRLTVNPVRHLDMFGTLMLLIIGFGWGKPVRFNPYNLKDQKWGPAIISIAGPLTNLLLAVIFAAALRFSGMVSTSNGLQIFLQYGFAINVLLMVFNLIPIPPLDGSKVAFALLPQIKEETKARLEQYGPFLILILIFLAGGVFSTIYITILNLIARIFGIA